MVTKNSDHICIHHSRCYNTPICYPLILIDQRISPPKQKETCQKTTTIAALTLKIAGERVNERSMPNASFQTKAKDDICATTTWSRYGITLLGGKGTESSSVNLNYSRGMFIRANQTLYIVDNGNSGS
ncbi:unnamed protein product [Adineta ricciae]|uniref:Uncharacterized protein n=1 Tax=Adineta ricciae TaxID=249248 RepID=A0A814TDF6_ADIRI|nr:unnamed protein product [Adineta ricciae]CAF1548241.1 unnamed protein product [Adineta ricciae]